MSKLYHLFDNSKKPKVIWLHGKKYYSNIGFSIFKQKPSNENLNNKKNKIIL